MKKYNALMIWNSFLVFLYMMWYTLEDAELKDIDICEELAQAVIILKFILIYNLYFMEHAFCKRCF